jgi:hypothetical protein
LFRRLGAACDCGQLLDGGHALFAAAVRLSLRSEAGSKQSETFKVMERRLLKAIINPAMIVTWLAGLYLAWAGHWFSARLAARSVATAAAGSQKKASLAKSTRVTISRSALMFTSTRDRSFRALIQLGIAQPLRNSGTKLAHHASVSQFECLAATVATRIFRAAHRCGSITRRRDVRQCGKTFPAEL